MNIQDLRISYDKGSLSRGELPDEPFGLFRAWLEDAKEAGILEPNAMTLATATKAGVPSARIVLLKGLDSGFRFFTNYESHKARELNETQHAALVFYWDTLHRQVRIQGRVEKLTKEESEGYFWSRPRSSQIGAHVSPQSREIPNRAFIENLEREISQRFEKEEKIPLPENWGGFRVVPVSVEFWVGRESRLHDRFRYERDGDAWQIKRLAP